jgi:hypothetical protein
VHPATAIRAIARHARFTLGLIGKKAAPMDLFNAFSLDYPPGKITARALFKLPLSQKQPANAQASGLRNSASQIR